MHILLVDDDPANVRLLDRLLTADGHEVRSAENGAAGVEAFVEDVPDLVLLDVQMPVLDGYGAARLMKAQCGDRFVPILFLTAMNDEESLARCVDAGGDDFLGKPYSRVLLRSKIRSLERIHRLHGQVSAQARDLEAHRARTERELQIAEGIMSRITRTLSEEIPGVIHEKRSVESFCGDLVLAGRTPGGGVTAFLGDFTGHGLPAAVCALPIAETFTTMCRKGFGVGEIACEMNDKLRSILSTGLFCAACVLQVDAEGQRVSIWNGGLPDVLVLDRARRVVRRVASTHLALGVAESDPSTRAVEVVDLGPEHQVLAASDGVVEAQNSTGDMYGSERLERDLLASRGELVPAVFSAVEGFTGSAAGDDDITVLLLDGELLGEGVVDSLAPSQRRAVAGEWSATWELGASTLKEVDPLPIVLDAWRDFPAPQHLRSPIYTVLAELYNNALDHGLLRLDSSLKEGAEGFVRYAEARQRALAELTEGTVRITLGHRARADGGEVEIAVEDSGPGFDVAAWRRDLAENRANSGRGVRIVEELCDAVEYSPRGNRVRARFAWSCAQVCSSRP